MGPKSHRAPAATFNPFRLHNESNFTNGQQTEKLFSRLISSVGAVEASPEADARLFALAAPLKPHRAAYFINLWAAKKRRCCTRADDAD
jgi:hypothetical protein